MTEEKTKRFLEIFKQCDSFFKEALDEAIKNQDVRISEEAASYLLWILLRGLSKDPHFNPKTTIERYVAAFTGKGPESFRDIGDSSLMISGIWWESLRRRLVGIDYYIKMGQLAYRKEAEASKSLEELFEELSENFIQSVNILMEATHFISKGEPSPGDILKIYEAWLETHNAFLERKLRSLGINPVDIKAGKQ